MLSFEPVLGFLPTFVVDSWLLFIPAPAFFFLFSFESSLPPFFLSLSVSVGFDVGGNPAPSGSFDGVGSLLCTGSFELSGSFDGVVSPVPFFSFSLFDVSSFGLSLLSTGSFSNVLSISNERRSVASLSSSER